jgi:uncharacterized membrane protein
MTLYVLAISMTIVANVGYHLIQRTIRPDLHPLVSLLATYLTALLATAVCWPLMSKGSSLSDEVGKLGWQSFALGIAVVLLEAGFLLAYRAGWQISVAALYSNASVALLLLPFGVLAFSERIDLTRGIGLAFALVGLVLLSRRPG